MVNLHIFLVELSYGMGIKRKITRIVIEPLNRLVLNKLKVIYLKKVKNIELVSALFLVIKLGTLKQKSTRLKNQVLRVAGTGLEPVAFGL